MLGVGDRFDLILKYSLKLMFYQSALIKALDLLSPASAVGLGTGDIATPPPPPHLSVRLSVCQTLQVRTPCHGGVLYSFFHIDGMLFEFFMNFLNIEKKKY